MISADILEQLNAILEDYELPTGYLDPDRRSSDLLRDLLRVLDPPP